MTKTIPTPRTAFPAAVLSGLMLTASFQPGTTDWLAWIALVPLLVAIRNTSPGRSFRLGLAAGITHFLSLMYWIVVVIKAYGGIPILPSLFILLALSTYLGLYPGLFALFYSAVHTSRMGILLGASLWVGLEYLRGWLFTGLPWCLLGYSQAARITLIQISDLVGVYGLSFLVAAVNISLFNLLFDRPRMKRGIQKLEVGLVLLCLVLAILYGRGKMEDTRSMESSIPPICTALVQGNVDQAEKWRPEFQQKTMDTYRRLSLKASRWKPDLIVWPETSVPFFFQDPTPLAAGILAIPGMTGADLLFGSPAYTGNGDQVRYLNRAYLLSGEDAFLTFYDKVHLVPFGEYVPLQRFFPFVHRLVTAAGDFSAGERVAPLKRPQYAAGVLICFEAIFPRIARQQANEGADLLVNLTNDAWFGRTSAPFQHLCMSAFRAVETGLPLVRAANTGISAFIDPFGRVTQPTRLFEEAVIVETVQPQRGSRTFYSRHGDLLPLFLLAVISAKLILFRRPRGVDLRGASS